MDKLPPHLKLNILSLLEKAQPELKQEESSGPLPSFVDPQKTDLAQLHLFSKQDFDCLVNEGLLIKNRFLQEYAAKTREVTSTPSLCPKTILDVCQDYFKQGKLRKAGMQGKEKWVESSVRGDDLCWLHVDDPSLPPVLKEFIYCIKAHVSELAKAANLEIEGHYEFQLAHYDENKARYVRHCDAPPGGPPRKLTCIFYPNVNWRPGQGGELRAFLPSGPRDIQPSADRLVVFWSAWLDHEVLASLTSRFALTVWVR